MWNWYGLQLKILLSQFELLDKEKTDFFELLVSIGMQQKIGTGPTLQLPPLEDP
jgi:hypothetical protein